MPTHQPTTANLNLKVTEDERWNFKGLGARHRMSLVNGLRFVFKLMKDHFADEDK